MYCMFFSGVDLAGRSAMSKVTMDVDGGSASRSAGAYIQNLGSRNSDSNTWQMAPAWVHTMTCTAKQVQDD